MRLFDEIGLPFYLMSFAKPANRESAIETYRVWAEANAERAIIMRPSGGWDLSNIELHIAMSDYLASHFFDTELFHLLQKLIWLQHNVKKKRARILQETTQTKNQEQPPSLATRAALASIRRKRLRLVPSSSSSL